MTRRILSLVLLLTQAATTFAGPAFTLCVSPKGHTCIDAPWTVCDCCQYDGGPDHQPDHQDDPTRGVADDNKKVCESEKRGSCRCGHDESLTAAITTDPMAAPFSAISHGQPCRCKHIPLIVAQVGQQPAVEPISVGDRHAHDQFLTAPVASLFGGFLPSRDAVAILPQPPPSGHLLAISCTVLRC